MINKMDTSSYQYNLYNEYLEKTDENLIKYSSRNSIPIQYFNIIVNESKNWTDTEMQRAYKDFVYDVYHLLPIVDLTPLSHQTGFSTANHGTSTIASGTCTLYLLAKPLPGDIFKFYSENDVTDSREIFRVDTVRYVRSSKHKLKVYQIDFTSAPMSIHTLNELRINKTYYWNTERFNFIDGQKYENFVEVLETRDALVQDLNSFYNKTNGWYSPVGADKPMLHVNTIIKRLKKQFSGLPLKVTPGVCPSDISIEEFISVPIPTYSDILLGSDTMYNIGAIIENPDLCVDCPNDITLFTQEYLTLYEKVLALTVLLQPLLTEEELKDKSVVGLGGKGSGSGCGDTSLYLSLLASIDELSFDIDGQTPVYGTGIGFNDPTGLQSSNIPQVPLWISLHNGLGPLVDIPTN